jgi:hypothetical protein
MFRTWLENLLFPEMRHGAMLVTLEPEMFPQGLLALEKMELVNRAIEIADVTARHDTCLVIREADGSLGVYSIPDGPSGGGVTSIRDKVIADALKYATKVA